ncbi:glycosyltransferase [Proteus terrae]|uniref:glycosyltransferase n=1 Tax=Proteus terrae TaxID=1574161 RepID=UPI0034E3C37D
MENITRFNVVFNCTVNVVGGAVQNAANFIKQVEINHRCDDFRVYYCLSYPVYQQVKDVLLEGTYSVFDSPAKSLKVRKGIRAIVRDLNPSIVYTSAGPAYVKFDCHHIMGCSNPYLLEPSSYALKLGNSFWQIIKRRFHTAYQSHYIKHADSYIFQTKTSQESFCRKFNCDDYFIVNNAISQKFVQALSDTSISKFNHRCSTLFVPSAYYKHKNLEVTLYALSILNKDNPGGYKLIFTLPSDIYRNFIEPVANKLKLQDYVENIGPFTNEQASDLYLKYDVVIQPSVMEVFSTTYLEAISLLKPLVVSDLMFAHEICEDYPYYFKSSDPDSLAEAVIASANFNEQLTKKKDISTGIINKYGCQSLRTKHLVDILKDILRVKDV